MTDRKHYLQRYPTGRIDFRLNHKSLGTLPLPEGSDAFNAEYDRLLASVRGKIRKRGGWRRGRPEPKAATIGLFVARWLASDFWADPAKPHLKEVPYADTTKKTYRLAIKAMQKEGMTGKQFADLTPNRASLYIAKAKREHGGAAARRQKTLLNILWEFGKGFPDFDGGDRHNPMTNTKSPYSVKREHLPWPEEVQDKFLAACDENLYDCFHLLICTGQRISDVAKMRKHQYDGKHITLIQQKTKTPMRIKAPKMLQDVLRARADRQRQRVRQRGIGDNSGAAVQSVQSAARAATSPFLLTHAWGNPYGATTLSEAFSKVTTAIGHPEYTAHGLRKNAGILLAENGATVPQIMAALGHRTPKMALYYCRLANQNKLADQAADILDLAFADREKSRTTRTRKTPLKLVD